MKIALIGYGRMGQAIETIALERGHTISAKVNSENPIESVDLTDTDVAIEFSVPQTVVKNINTLLDKKIPVVVGTTGWNDSLNEISKRVESEDLCLLHASNFSVGVNLFFKLNEQLAKLMNPHSDYYVSMEEIHHTKKLDAPSGTAITLAEEVISNHKAVDNWNCPQHPTNNDFNGGIEINALRIPDVPGTHEIRYQSDIDTISIKHEAHSRKGFATGAVIAAEWLINKKGVYTMRDVLEIN